MELPGLLRGTVVGRIGKRFQVLVESARDGAAAASGAAPILVCTLKGRFRVEEDKNPNLCVVGDRVEVEPQSEGEGVIAAILPRTSEVARSEGKNPRGRFRKDVPMRVLLSNLDVVFVTMAVRHPELILSDLDRFLVLVEAAGQTAAIVLNKTDLEGSDATLATLEPYRRFGYEVLAVSASTGMGMPALRAAVAGRTALLAGPSGAGKSALARSLTGREDIVIGLERPAKGAGGRQTTTQTRLYPIDATSFIADCPGFYVQGLDNVKVRDLPRCYPEFRAITDRCRYQDCLHTDEPGCVLPDLRGTAAFDDGRYQRYLKILSEIRAAQAA